MYTAVNLCSQGFYYYIKPLYYELEISIMHGNQECIIYCLIIIINLLVIPNLILILFTDTLKNTKTNCHFFNNCTLLGYMYSP